MVSRKGDGRVRRGKAGEEAAQALLERSGYRIIDANVRFGAKSGLIGELDIVAWEGSTLCFVEVKSRTGTVGRVHPGEAVTPAKQRQIAQLALAYTARAGLLKDEGDGIDLRFDVVTVVLAPAGEGETAVVVRSARLWRGAFLAEAD